MTVIVKGMDMPENCASCDFRVVDGIGKIRCGKTYSRIGITCACYERMKDCPLRSVEGLIEYIKKHSYPVRYDRNSIEQVMTITGIEQAIKEYCGLEE